MANGNEKPALDWSDYWHRVARAFVTGASSAFTALPVFQLLTGGDASLFQGLEHIGAAVLAGGFTAAATAMKAGWGQGRGTNPADGSLK